MRKWIEVNNQEVNVRTMHDEEVGRWRNETSADETAIPE